MGALGKGNADTMLVVMQSGSARGEIDAVCDHVQAAGLDTEVFTDAGRTVIDVAGETAPGLKEMLEMLPGVDAVVRRDAPGALKTRDLRIVSIRPLVPPAILLEELPLSSDGAEAVSAAREEVGHILRGEDDRLIVI